MSDRKLLEDAAKAAGHRVHGSVGDKFYVCQISPDDQNFDPFVWNPLTDDGDALRLAVNRRIVIDVGSVAAHAYKDGPGVVVPLGDDPYAATRRAIVREAAAIGAAK